MSSRTPRWNSFKFGQFSIKIQPTNELYGSRLESYDSGLYIKQFELDELASSHEQHEQRQSQNPRKSCQSGQSGHDNVKRNTFPQEKIVQFVFH